MKYAELLFNKPFKDIALKDVEDFFSREKEETNTLEFKSGEKKIERLCDGICAFLNTSGGLIIYGSPTEKVRQKGNYKISFAQGELKECKEFKDKDALYNSILSHIQPMPVNIKIHPIEKDDGYIFLIEVPMSPYSPHQASNRGVYFIRPASFNTPAPHHIVSALFNKRQRPRIECSFAFVNHNPISNEYCVLLENKNIITASDVGFFITIVAHENSVKEIKDNRKIYGSKTINGSLISHYINVPSIPNILAQNQYYFHPIHVSFKKYGCLMAKIGYYCRDGEYLEQINIINPRLRNCSIDQFYRKGGLYSDNKEIEQKIKSYHIMLSNEELTPLQHPGFS